MDYKELIEWLRRVVEHGDANPQGYCTNRCGGCEVCDQAADAMEILLAERDAAVEDLRGRCWCCVHGEPWEPAGPLSKLMGCEHLSELGVLARGGGKCKCPHWKWRGPQKGDWGVTNHERF